MKQYLINVVRPKRFNELNENNAQCNMFEGKDLYIPKQVKSAIFIND